MSWVRENLDNYEVTVIHHDNNGSYIPHAHVVINNTNLEADGRHD